MYDERLLGSGGGKLVQVPVKGRHRDNREYRRGLRLLAFVKRCLTFKAYRGIILLACKRVEGQPRYSKYPSRLQKSIPENARFRQIWLKYVGGNAGTDTRGCLVPSEQGLERCSTFEVLHRQCKASNKESIEPTSIPLVSAEALEMRLSGGLQVVSLWRLSHVPNVPATSL